MPGNVQGLRLHSAESTIHLMRCLKRSGHDRQSFAGDDGPIDTLIEVMETVKGLHLHGGEQTGHVSGLVWSSVSILLLALTWACEH